MPDGEDTGLLDPTPAEETSRRGFPWTRLIVAGLALALLVGLVLPVFSTLQPRYYERYPGLAERMQNWRESTHARVSCAGCHVDPGVGGFVKFAARSIPDFYSQLIVGPKSTNLLRVPDRQACQKCHTVYRQISSSGDLLIPHRAHVEVLGINCAVCHKNLVHSKNTQGFNKPEMKMCLSTCHDGKKATNQCSKCHTRKEVPDNHRQPNWPQAHSTWTNKMDCGSCHAWTPDYCQQCHSQRPASHVGNWKQLHQFEVEKRGEKGCLVCHAEEFCKECH